MKFDNEKVEVEVENKGGCLVELSVVVKAKACEEIRGESQKAIRHHVSVPGFRKGKAPVKMIEKNYAKAIEEEFADRVVKAGLNETLNLTKIYPWSGEGVPKPEVEEVSVEGSRMKFSFEREPEIPELKGEALSLKREEKKVVTDEMVQTEIDELRRQRATYEDSDEKAKENGWCRIDLENLKEEPAVKILTDHRVQLDGDKVAGWLINLAKGKVAGESAEGMTEPSNDMSKKEKDEFEPAKVRVTVVAVEKEVLPDDKTLCEVLKVESIEELRGKVTAKQGEEEDRRVDAALKKSLWDQLRSKYPFELPKSLVETELQTTIRRLVDELRQQGKGDKEIQEEEKAIEERAAAEVAHRLHTLFIARKVTADAGNQPTDEEINQRTHELMLWESLSQGRMQDPKTQDPRVLNAYRQRSFLMLMQEKAEEHLLAAANIA